MQRKLLAAGVIAPPLFVATIFIESATRPDYSSWRHYVSELALSSDGWMQVANFVVTGALTLVYALGVWRATRARAGAAALVIYALALIAVGIFVTDPALGYPPGASGAQTAHGRVHAVAGLVAFTSTSAVCFLFSARVPPRAWGIGAGIATLAFVVAANAAGALDGSGVITNAPVGLLQRISIVTGQVFFFTLAWRLFNESPRSARDAPPSA